MLRLSNPEEEKGRPMSEKYENYEVLFAAYPTENGAAEALDALEELQKTKAIDILDAAVLVKDADGNVTVKQRSLPSVKKGLGIGALIGGVIGLVFPPALLASAAVGAGVGAGAAKLVKSAIEDPDLRAAAESLDPGTSAAIAVVDNRWVAQIQEVIAGYEKLAEHALDADAAGVLGALVGESGEVAYGQVATDTAAAEFAVATDGDVVAGTSTVAAVADDGTVVVDRAAGMAAADEEGNVAMVGDEVAVVADSAGNVAAAEAVDVAAMDTEGNVAGVESVDVAYAPAPDEGTEEEAPES